MAFGLLAVVVGVVWYFSTLTPEQMQRYSSFVANIILFGVILMFIAPG